MIITLIFIILCVGLSIPALNLVLRSTGLDRRNRILLLIALSITLVSLQIMSGSIGYMWALDRCEKFIDSIVMYNVMDTHV